MGILQHYTISLSYLLCQFAESDKVESAMMLTAQLVEPLLQNDICKLFLGKSVSCSNFLDSGTTAHNIQTLVFVIGIVPKIIESFRLHEKYVRITHHDIVQIIIFDFIAIVRVAVFHDTWRSLLDSLVFSSKECGTALVTAVIAVIQVLCRSESSPSESSGCRSATSTRSPIAGLDTAFKSPFPGMAELHLENVLHLLILVCRIEDFRITAIKTVFADNLIECIKSFLRLAPLEIESSKQSICGIFGRTSFICLCIPFLRQSLCSFRHVIDNQFVNLVRSLARLMNLALVNRCRSPHRDATIGRHQVEVENRPQEFRLGYHQLSVIAADRSGLRHINDGIASLDSIITPDVVTPEKFV